MMGFIRRWLKGKKRILLDPPKNIFKDLTYNAKESKIPNACYLKLDEKTSGRVEIPYKVETKSEETIVKKYTMYDNATGKVVAQWYEERTPITKQEVYNGD